VLSPVKIESLGQQKAALQKETLDKDATIKKLRREKDGLQALHNDASARLMKKETRVGVL